MGEGAHGRVPGSSKGRRPVPAASQSSEVRQVVYGLGEGLLENVPAAVRVVYVHNVGSIAGGRGEIGARRAEAVATFPEFALGGRVGALSREALDDLDEPQVVVENVELAHHLAVWVPGARRCPQGVRLAVQTTPAPCTAAAAHAQSVSRMVPAVSGSSQRLWRGDL